MRITPSETTHFARVLLVFPRPLEDFEADAVCGLLGYWAKAGVYLPREQAVETLRTAPDRILAYVDSRDSRSHDLWAREPFDCLRRLLAGGSNLRRDGTRLIDPPGVLPAQVVLDPSESLVRPRPVAPTGPVVVRRPRAVARPISGANAEAPAPLAPRVRALLFD